ncbi:MAG: hypothetical protein RTU92_14615 [Candidatus Thorarchaeota archaeon]
MSDYSKAIVLVAFPIILFLGPSVFVIDDRSTSIMSSVWGAEFLYHNQTLNIDTISNPIFLAFLLISSLRLFFILQLFRFLNGDTTRSRAILAGLLGEMPFTLVGLWSFFNPSPYYQYMYSGPIPLLLIAGIILMYVSQPDVEK